MSKYKVGDVILAPVSYFDGKKGYYVSQERRWVIVKIDEPSKNITVSCTGQLHQAKNYQGIIVKHNSTDGIIMRLTMDTFIYCEKTQMVDFLDSEITRRLGTCPLINEILGKLNL